MKTERIAVAHAVIRFLDAQHVERDGVEHKFFQGCFGILGHGNVGGVGEALLEYPQFRFYPCRNEQAMVHIAAGFTKMRNRLSTFACTSSIGPGATNMVTGAALATINRLPVLLLPGDIFARRNVGPVLQQLERESSLDISVNDCFKPVSQYWDRINRPDQLIHGLMEAMRTLVSPSRTGAVTLALPQDVQAEACEFPSSMFEKRVWAIPRNRPDRQQLERAAALIRKSERPLIVVGGGVLYSEATQELDSFCSSTGIPTGETQAGKGALHYEHPQNLGGVGSTGTLAANRIAASADLVIGIGTRYSDFTTASKTAFQNPGIRFININVAELDGFKHNALPLLGDARATLQELLPLLENTQISLAYESEIKALQSEWNGEVERLMSVRRRPLPSQTEVLGVVNRFIRPRDVVVSAAGSLPGDFHKIWRCRDPKCYHLEYGYSCMGYEIPAAIGIKMADPSREVYAIIGDGNYLMMSQEIVTSIQEGIRINIIVLDNHGYASIGGLSEGLGCERFGTKLRYRTDGGQLDGAAVPVQFAKNAESLCAHAIFVSEMAQFESALEKTRSNDRTTVIVVETVLDDGLPTFDSWWDVPICDASQRPSVIEARRQYDAKRASERTYLDGK